MNTKQAGNQSEAAVYPLELPNMFGALPGTGEMSLRLHAHLCMEPSACGSNDLIGSREEEAKYLDTVQRVTNHCADHSGSEARDGFIEPPPRTVMGHARRAALHVWGQRD